MVFTETPNMSEPNPEYMKMVSIKDLYQISICGLRYVKRSLMARVGVIPKEGGASVPKEGGASVLLLVRQ